MASVVPQNVNIEQNMGTMDRIVRSAIGGMLLVSGLMMPGRMFGRIETLVGGAFIFYGVTGFDPLLKLFETSTKPEDPNNVMKKVQSTVKTTETTGRPKTETMAGIGV